MRTELISPASANKVYNESSLLLKLRFPTNNVLEGSEILSPNLAARSLFGVLLEGLDSEMSTLIGRPSTSVPFNFKAAFACSAVSKSTYPNPLGRPVLRSVMILDETTPPISSKIRPSHSSSMFQERLPTKTEEVPPDSGFARFAGVSVAEEGASLRF